MSDRIHIVLDGAEKERYRALAEREGKNLSEWIRQAVRERAATYSRDDGALDSPESLQAYFDELDRLRGDDPTPEPDWEDQERAIADSKTHGLPRP